MVDDVIAFLRAELVWHVLVFQHSVNWALCHVALAKTGHHHANGGELAHTLDARSFRTHGRIALAPESSYLEFTGGTLGLSLVLDRRISCFPGKLQILHIVHAHWRSTTPSGQRSIDDGHPRKLIHPASLTFIVQLIMANRHLGKINVLFPAARFGGKIPVNP